MKRKTKENLGDNRKEYTTRFKIGTNDKGVLQSALCNSTMHHTTLESLEDKLCGPCATDRPKNVDGTYGTLLQVLTIIFSSRTIITGSSAEGHKEVHQILLLRKGPSIDVDHDVPNAEAREAAAAGGCHHH